LNEEGSWKECRKEGEGVKFLFKCGKSGKGRKEWMGVGRSGLGSLNHEKNRVLVVPDYHQSNATNCALVHTIFGYC